MSSYVYENAVNTTKLRKEISATNLGSKLDYINSDGNNVIVFTKVELTIQEQEDLESLVMAHVTFDQAAQIESILIAAKEFGQRPISSTAAYKEAVSIAFFTLAKYSKTGFVLLA